MLEQISWKEFLIAIGGGCAAYYGVLAVAGKMRFARSSVKTTTVAAYRGSKTSSTSGTDLTATARDPDNEPLGETKEETGQADDPEFTALELLADQVQVIITQSGITPTGKEELLAQLRKEIARYPSLNQPAFRRAINNLIVKVAKEECQLTITQEEARECWPEP